jgi:gas vesicle protein
MNEHKPDLALMLSFLAGGVVGAGLALLLAPPSGKATREMMGRKLRDTARSARGLNNDASTAASADDGNGAPEAIPAPGGGPRN